MTRPGSYTYLSDEQWDARISAFDRIASSCTLCPRQCRIDRFASGKGFCRAPGTLVISSIFPHHGEEPPISGSHGSGTVFFTFCTLRCTFCQNYQLSHNAEGREYSPMELAGAMLELQSRGCHNINLVTATHFLPWILRALKEAARNGLTIPIVFNCGGYELSSTLSLLSGIVDIYLPDMKYGNNRAAGRYSNAVDYVEINRNAIREMFRQVGPLQCNELGIAWRGLCIRHLVLPGNTADSTEIIDFLSSTFDPNDIYISLMAQYRPLFRASSTPEINRAITAAEYEPLKKRIIELGFDGFVQDLHPCDEFVIDFTKRKNEPLRPVAQKPSSQS